MKTLNVALVGCGLISEAHVRAYLNHSDRARIVLCCDLDREKAQQRADQVGNARVTDSYEAVLADPEVDAVEICTPHHLHKEAVIAAARAGKQILCQKPLAKSLEDCDEMIRAAEEAGVTLFYGEANHTVPTAVEARRAIEEGKIGTLIGIQATYAHWQGGAYLSTAWRYNPKITGGGQLLDGGIHFVDLMRWVGGEIESVASFNTRFREELGGEDTAVVNMRYKARHLGALFSSQAAGIWFPDASFVAFGTEGVLTMGGPHGPLTLHRPDLPEKREPLLKEGDWENSFTVMIGKYLDTVLDGATNPSPGSVGREDLKIVLAAYRSAELGREVRLDEMEPEQAPPSY